MRNLGVSKLVIVAAGLVIANLLAATSGFAETKVDCKQSPQTIVRALRGADPVLSLQRAGKALESCGKARYIDLIIDRTTIEIPFQARQHVKLAGTWVSDMWLHVQEGITSAVAELLVIENTRVDQGIIRWHDADKQQQPSYLDAYMPRFGTANLVTGETGLKIAGFVPTGRDSVHNPYAARTGAAAKKHIQQMMTVVAIHLGRISRISVSGDRLMLVDDRGIVRTYRRHSTENVLASHKFFLATNVSARSWPCLLGVLAGRLADKATQNRTLLMVAKALNIPSIQKELAKINVDLKKLKPNSAQASGLTKERARLSNKLRAIYSDDFQSFTAQFDDPDQPPAYCQSR